MNYFKFETERLFIRNYKKADLEDFVRVTSQPEIQPTTYGIPVPYTKKYAKKWMRFIRENIRMKQAYEFAVFLKEDLTYIGNVGLINVSRMHNHADISYYIDKDLWNRGLATEAAAQMLNFGFEKLGMYKISGLCMTSNPASRRVMEKLGMKYEGTMRRELLKNGTYYDIYRFSILKEEYFTNSKG